MSERSIRVNQLVQRELSTILRTNFREEAVRITITSTDISPALRHGKVYYSVLGSEDDIANAGRFFARYKRMIGQQLWKRVTFKYSPKLSYHVDDSIVRGMHTTKILDEIEATLPPLEPEAFEEETDYKAPPLPKKPAEDSEDGEDANDADHIKNMDGAETGTN